MSIDKNIYIGPYAVVPKEQVEKAVSVDGCQKCKTENGKDGFCSKCGAKRTTYKKVVKVNRVDDWDLSDKMKERLISPHPMSSFLSATEEFWIPNVDIPGIKRQVHFSGGTAGDDQRVIPMSENMMGIEEKAFREFFKDDLETIKDAYSKLDVKWGLIIYYS